MIVSKPLFIHQYPDWTKFRYNAQSVMDALGQTRLIEGALVGVADLVCDSDTETRMLAIDIAANYALDGYTLEIPILESEIKKKNSARNDIRNFVGAIQNAKLPLTEERLFAWHAAIGQNKVKSFRTKESFAGTFTGISPERIPLEIGRFIDWFENSTQDGAIKAAIAHFWFLTIRPFEDGNGRIARALAAMLLARSEDTTRCQYALNEQILKDRENYIQTLFKAQAGNGDLTEWILWFLSAMQKSIDDSKKEIAGALKKMQFLQKNQQADLSGRERRIIEAVWNGELPAVFSVKEVAALTGTSHDSALRDIQDLIQKEIVRPENKGGRSQKYSLI
ncbi:MAG: Fic family protein [Fibrobacter sp.]|nr:Fic family protein [Fibrobacter sp.]